MNDIKGKVNLKVSPAALALNGEPSGDVVQAIVDCLRVAETAAASGANLVDPQKAGGILFSAFSTMHIRALDPAASLEAHLASTRHVMKEGLDQLLWAVRKNFQENKN